MRIPIQKTRAFRFQAEALGPGAHAALTLTAYVESTFGGFSPPLELRLNGHYLTGPRLVNKPLLFTAASGQQSAWFQSNSFGKVWVLYYARDLSSIAGSPYRPVGEPAADFSFDVSDLIQAENVLTLRNAYTVRVQKVTRSAVPIVVMRLAIEFPSELRAPSARQMNRPPIAYAEPRTRWQVPFKVSASPDGGVSFQFNQVVARLRSRYLWTGEKPRFFPQPPGTDTSWLKGFYETESGWELSARDSKLSLARTVHVRDTHAEIRDTLTNISAGDLGIIVKYEVEFPTAGDRVAFFGGNRIRALDHYVSNPENPTAYAFCGGGGLGLVAVSDVFRVHHQAYLTQHGYGMTDRQLALAPGASAVLEYWVYPTVSSSYFRFINAVRRDWGLNEFRASGHHVNFPWTYISERFEREPLDNLLEERHARWPGVNAVLVFMPVIMATRGTARERVPQYGYPLLRLEDPVIRRYIRVFSALRKALPESTRLLGYYGPPNFSVGRDSIERFPRCRITHADGTQVFGEDGDSRFPLFYPTMKNAFGSMVRDAVDRWLDWGADGIYFDYFEPTATKARYTFDTWDGVSAQLELSTAKILRKYASTDLLSRDFLVDLVRRIQARGGTVLANRGSTTQTVQEATRHILRLGESGNIGQLARSHLTPCPAALIRISHLPEIHDQVLVALDAGMITIPYDRSYKFPDNAVSASFPIQFLEGHEGYVIGRDKIVTKRSGTFGFGDDGKLTWRVYDAAGRTSAQVAEIVRHNGKIFLRIDLSPKQIAIIKRLR